MAVEQQFVLRVADTSLADYIRRCLREEETLEGGLELRFRGRCEMPTLTKTSRLARADSSVFFSFREWQGG